MGKRECIRTGSLVLLLVCGLSGCAMLKDKPATEDLNLVMAGMEGSDGVSFKGAAALLVGGRTLPESALYYGGKVADHNRISLYSLLPGEGPAASAQEPGLRQLRQGSADTPVYYTQMVKENGKWTLKQDSTALAGSNPLENLNPLRHLEELEQRQKTVTEEAGSARGTRVLRIELTAAEARSQLADELEQEMQAIRPAAPDSKGSNSSRHSKALEARTALWEQKRAELQQRLETADIKTVYYLKVDPKRNRPAGLTWNRTLTYPDKTGAATQETYITQVDFYDYQ